MININGNKVRVITTTEFFPLGIEIEEKMMRMFDGVQLSKPYEWIPEKVQEYTGQDKEVVFHSKYGITQIRNGEVDKEIQYVKEAGIKSYSMAFGFSCASVVSTEYGFLLSKDSTRICGDPQEFLDCVFYGVDYLRERLRTHEIALENLDYHTGGAYEFCWEPEVINAVFRRLRNLNVFLLFDFGHAEVSISNKGGNLSSYIENLPVEAVSWIHLHTANRTLNGVAFDAHNPPKEYEIQKLKAFPNLRRVVLECPHNIPAMLKRIKEDVEFFYNES